MVGDIYLAKIYFTDLSTDKIRPVLVIKVLDDDCICLPLTSQMKEKALMIAQQDLLQGVLKKILLSLLTKISRCTKAS